MYATARFINQNSAEFRRKCAQRAPRGRFSAAACRLRERLFLIQYKRNEAVQRALRIERGQRTIEAANRSLLNRAFHNDPKIGE